MSTLLLRKLQVKSMRLDYFTGIKYGDTTTLKAISKSAKLDYFTGIKYDDTTTLEAIGQMDETRLLHMYKIGLQYYFRNFRAKAQDSTTSQV